MKRRLRIGAAAAVLAVALFTGASAPDPLLDAAERGDVAAVRALLRGGADPNVALGDGLTALHIAAERGNLEIVELLIGAKANVEAKTRLGDYTPLHVAASGAHATVVRALLAAGANPRAVTSSGGATALHLAARAMDGELAVRELLQKGADVDALESTYGQTALMFAASYGRTASVKELLGGGADPAVRTRVVDVLRSMALDKAAEERLQEAITAIRGDSPEGTDRELTTAEVRQAIEAQREFLHSEAAVAEALKDYHPDDLAREGSYWDTPTGQKSELKITLRPRWETWVGITGGMTALLYAVREGHLETAVALLDGGAEIDEVSGDGTTPLVESLLNGQFETAMMLIERGADVNLATHTDGVSPLFAVLQTQWAARFTESYSQPRSHDNQSVRHMDLLNALLERGADPNVRLKTHLWYWEHVDGPTSKMGLDITGATPFWRAAFAQDVDAMRALVAHGADPNIPTIWPDPGLRNGVGGSGRQSDGRIMEDSGLPVIPEGAPNMYPIHAASGGGYLGLGAFHVNNVPNNFVNAVKFLVEEHGADVDLPDSWGYTPLHYASVRGGNDLIEYLVSKGADVKAESRLGQTTADMARGGNAGYFSRTPYPATVELLQKLGAELKCFHTHFRGTGDYCPGSGAPLFEGIYQNSEAPVP